MSDTSTDNSYPIQLAPVAGSNNDTSVFNPNGDQSGGNPLSGLSNGNSSGGATFTDPNYRPTGDWSEDQKHLSWSGSPGNNNNGFSIGAPTQSQYTQAPQSGDAGSFNQLFAREHPETQATPTSSSSSALPTYGNDIVGQALNWENQNIGDEGLRSFVHGATESVVPLVGGLAVGAAAGSIVPGPGTAVGAVLGAAIGLGAGILGGQAGSWIQDQAMSRIMTPDEIEKYKQQRAQEMHDTPAWDAAGSLVPSLVAFHPSGRTLLEAGNLFKVVSAAVKNGDRQTIDSLLSDKSGREAINTIFFAGLGTGQSITQAYQQYQQGDFSPLASGINLLGSVLLNKPRAWTSRIMDPGQVNHADAGAEKFQDAAKNGPDPTTFDYATYQRQADTNAKVEQYNQLRGDIAHRAALGEDVSQEMQSLNEMKSQIEASQVFQTRSEAIRNTMAMPQMKEIQSQIAALNKQRSTMDPKEFAQRNADLNAKMNDLVTVHTPQQLGDVQGLQDPFDVSTPEKKQAFFDNMRSDPRYQEMRIALAKKPEIKLLDRAESNLQIVNKSGPSWDRIKAMDEKYANDVRQHLIDTKGHWERDLQRGYNLLDREYIQHAQPQTQMSKPQSSAEQAIEQAQAAGESPEVKAVAPELIHQLKNPKVGGFTYDVTTGNQPQVGFAVATHPDRTAIVPMSRVTPEFVAEYAKRNADLLGEPNAHVGGWGQHTSPEAGKPGVFFVHVGQGGLVHLDVSEVHPTLEEAIKVGQQHNQQTVQDLTDFENGTHKVPGYNSRLGNGGNDIAQSTGRGYNITHGLPDVINHEPVRVDPERSTHIAQFYEAAPSDKDIPAVKRSWDQKIGSQILHAYQTVHGVLGDAIRSAGIKTYSELVSKSYRALAQEVKQQFLHLPVKVEFVTDDPYKNSREMMDDVARGVLKIYKSTTEQAGAGGIMMEVDPETKLSYNDMFRAVHDYFGHAAGGHQFGPNGEENAWVHHSKMFTPLARLALTSETRGQNSWVNFHGNHQELPPTERPFAEQKSIILPPEYVDLPDLIPAKRVEQPNTQGGHDGISQETTSQQQGASESGIASEGGEVRVPGQGGEASGIQGAEERGLASTQAHNDTLAYHQPITSERPETTPTTAPSAESGVVGTGGGEAPDRNASGVPPTARTGVVHPASRGAGGDEGNALPATHAATGDAAAGTTGTERTTIEPAVAAANARTGDGSTTVGAALAAHADGTARPATGDEATHATNAAERANGTAPTNGQANATPEPNAARGSEAASGRPTTPEQATNAGNAGGTDTTGRRPGRPLVAEVPGLAEKLVKYGVSPDTVIPPTHDVGQVTDENLNTPAKGYKFTADSGAGANYSEAAQAPVLERRPNPVLSDVDRLLSKAGVEHESMPVIGDDASIIAALLRGKRQLNWYSDSRDFILNGIKHVGHTAQQFLGLIAAGGEGTQPNANAVAAVKYLSRIKYNLLDIRDRFQNLGILAGDPSRTGSLTMDNVKNVWKEIAPRTQKILQYFQSFMGMDRATIDMWMIRAFFGRESLSNSGVEGMAKEYVEGRMRYVARLMGLPTADVQAGFWTGYKDLYMDYLRDIKAKLTAVAGDVTQSEETRNEALRLLGEIPKAASLVGESANFSTIFPKYMGIRRGDTIPEIPIAKFISKYRDVFEGLVRSHVITTEDNAVRETPGAKALVIKLDKGAFRHDVVVNYPVLAKTFRSNPEFTKELATLYKKYYVDPSSLAPGMKVAMREFGKTGEAIAYAAYVHEYPQEALTNQHEVLDQLASVKDLVSLSKTGNLLETFLTSEEMHDAFPVIMESLGKKGVDVFGLHELVTDSDIKNIAEWRSGDQGSVRVNPELATLTNIKELIADRLERSIRTGRGSLTKDALDSLTAQVKKLRKAKDPTAVLHALVAHEVFHGMTFRLLNIKRVSEFPEAIVGELESGRLPVSWIEHLIEEGLGPQLESIIHNTETWRQVRASNETTKKVEPIWVREKGATLNDFRGRPDKADTKARDIMDVHQASTDILEHIAYQLAQTHDIPLSDVSLATDEVTRRNVYEPKTKEASAKITTAWFKRGLRSPEVLNRLASEAQQKSARGGANEGVDAGDILTAKPGNEPGSARSPGDLASTSDTARDTASGNAPGGRANPAAADQTGLGFADNRTRTGYESERQRKQDHYDSLVSSFHRVSEQEGITDTVKKLTTGNVSVDGILKALPQLKKYDPEAARNMIRATRQALGYDFPQDRKALETYGRGDTLGFGGKPNEDRPAPDIASKTEKAAQLEPKEYPNDNPNFEGEKVREAPGQFADRVAVAGGFKNAKAVKDILDAAINGGYIVERKYGPGDRVTVVVHVGDNARNLQHSPQEIAQSMDPLFALKVAGEPGRVVLDSLREEPPEQGLPPVDPDSFQGRATEPTTSIPPAPEKTGPEKVSPAKKLKILRTLEDGLQYEMDAHDEPAPGSDKVPKPPTPEEVKAAENAPPEKLTKDGFPYGTSEEVKKIIIQEREMKETIEVVKNFNDAAETASSSTDPRIVDLVNDMHGIVGDAMDGFSPDTGERSPEEQFKNAVRAQARAAVSYEAIGKKIDAMVGESNDRIRSAIEADPGPDKERLLANLNDNERAMANLLDAYYKVYGNIGKRLDILTSTLENFIPHVTVKPKKGEKATYDNIGTGTAATSTVHAIGRVRDKSGQIVHKTVEDLRAHYAAEGSGKEVMGNLGEIFAAHGRALSEAMIMRQYLRSMAGVETLLTGKNGGQVPARAIAKQDYIDGLPEELKSQYRTVDAGPMKNLLDGSRALRDEDIQWAKQGEQVRPAPAYKVYKPLADALERLAGPNDFKGKLDSGVKRINGLNGIFKQYIFISPLHAISMMSNFASVGGSKLTVAGLPAFLDPKVYGFMARGSKMLKENGGNGDDLKYAIRAGINPPDLKIPDDVSGNSGILQNLPIIGYYYKALHKVMWEKVGYEGSLGLFQHMHDEAVKNWINNNKGVPLTEEVKFGLAKEVAQVVRDASGFLNKLDMTKDWNFYGDTIFLANKWSTSQLRTVGKVVGWKALGNLGGGEQVRSHDNNDLNQYLENYNIKMHQRLLIGGLVRLFATTMMMGGMISWIATGGLSGGQASTPVSNYMKDPSHTFDVYLGRDKTTNKDKWLVLPFYLYQKELADYALSVANAQRQGKSSDQMAAAPFIKYSAKANPVAKWSLEMVSGREIGKWMNGYGETQTAKNDPDIDSDPTVVNIRKSLDAMGIPDLNQSIENRLIYTFRQFSPRATFPANLKQPTNDPGQLANALGFGTLNPVQPGNLGPEALGFIGVRTANGTQYVQGPNGEQPIYAAINASEQRTQNAKDMIAALAVGDFNKANMLRQQAGLSTGTAVQDIIYGISHTDTKGLAGVNVPPRDPFAPVAPKRLMLVNGKPVTPAQDAQLSTLQFARETQAWNILMANPNWSKMSGTEQEAMMKASSLFADKISQEQFSQELGRKVGSPISNTQATQMINETAMLERGVTESIKATKEYTQASPDVQAAMVQERTTAAQNAIWAKYNGVLKGATTTQLQQMINIQMSAHDEVRKFVPTLTQYQSAIDEAGQTKVMTSAYAYADKIVMDSLKGKSAKYMNGPVPANQIATVLRNGLVLEDSALEMLHSSPIYTEADPATQGSLDTKYTNLARNIALYDARDNVSVKTSQDLYQGGFAQTLRTQLVADQGYNDLLNTYFPGEGAVGLKQHQTDLANLKARWVQEQNIPPGQLGKYETQITRWYERNNPDYAEFLKARTNWEKYNPIGQAYSALAKGELTYTSGTPVRQYAQLGTQ